jgi:hypothetical protein
MWNWLFFFITTPLLLQNLPRVRARSVTQCKVNTFFPQDRASPSQHHTGISLTIASHTHHYTHTTILLILSARPFTDTPFQAARVFTSSMH